MWAAGVTVGIGGVQEEGWVAIEQLFLKNFGSLIARTHMVSQTGLAAESLWGLLGTLKCS